MGCQLGAVAQRIRGGLTEARSHPWSSQSPSPSDEQTAPACARRRTSIGRANNAPELDRYLALCGPQTGLRSNVEGVVQAGLIFAFLLFCGVGIVTLGPGRMDVVPASGLGSPRPMVIWAVWIGGLTLVVNTLSLVVLLFVFPSISAALLFWLMPYSLVLCVVDVAVYVRERRAVSISSPPTKSWAVSLVLSLSIAMFGLVILCIALIPRCPAGAS